MSGFVAWNAAHTEGRDPEETALSDSELVLPPMDEAPGQDSEIVGPTEAFLETLPVHDFPKQKQDFDQAKIRRAEVRFRPIQTPVPEFLRSREA